MKRLSSFRPLTGIVIFNDMTPEQSNALIDKRFRPLTGIMIFNECRRILFICHLMLSFRPLTGIMIFNYYSAATIFSMRLSEAFPSPYGDCDS